MRGGGHTCGTYMSKKAVERLRELASLLPLAARASSRNLALTFFEMSVQHKAALSEFPSVLLEYKHTLRNYQHFFQIGKMKAMRVKIAREYVGD